MKRLNRRTPNEMYLDDAMQLYCGKAVETMRYRISGPIQAVVTSPPYADQRNGLYDGIPESEYPDWTVRWMDRVKPLLAHDGSVFIVIREPIRNGEMSDYLLRTRLALRDAGWIECDELIWHKPDSPPVGHNKRPRRSWERILWFSNTRQPVCYPKSARIGRIGFESGDDGGTAQWRHGVKKAKTGLVRHPDHVSIGVSKNARTGHPAAYPVELAEWLVGLLAKPGDTVLDPFLGSGSTALACINLGVRFVGIEKNAEYFADAVRRIGDAP